jgi:hypothetical protein
MLNLSIGTGPAAVGTWATPSNDSPASTAEPAVSVAGVVEARAVGAPAAGTCRGCVRVGRGDGTADGLGVGVRLGVGPGVALGVGPGVGDRRGAGLAIVVGAVLGLADMAGRL